MVRYHRLIKLFRVRLSLIYDSNDLDSLGRGRGKKGFIGIPTIALEALLAKLKLDPTLYVYEMAIYLFVFIRIDGFRPNLISLFSIS